MQSLNGVEYLAGSAGFPTVPATVSATVTCEWWATTQQDVEDYSETPEVTALVIEGGLVCEHLYYFWSHVLCRATLSENKNRKNTERTRSNRHRLVFLFVCVHLMTRRLPVL